MIGRADVFNRQCSSRYVNHARGISLPYDRHSKNRGGGNRHGSFLYLHKMHVAHM